MPIYTLDQLRSSAPAEFRDLPEDELVRQYSQNVGMPFEDAANLFGVKPRGTLGEVGRQLVGGAVVDLPKMVGQGLQYTGIAPEYGREMAQAAEARAPGYEPDMRGRGLVGQAAVLGARGVAPMAPALAASMLPGGQFAAPVVAAGLFGTSSAQETYDKLVSQGVSEEDATAAARRVGLIQGPLEGAATAVGLRAAKGVSPLLGIGEKTTAGVAKSLTDTAVAKPFLKGMATNMVVQPATEVAQDVGSAMVERAYGGKEENIGDIAKQSALGGFGLTMLLGPLALGSHISRARGAEALKTALYDPQTPPQVRASAMDAVMAEAKRQGVADADVDNWFNEQLILEDKRNDALKQVEEEHAAGGLDLTAKPDDFEKRISEKLLSSFNPEEELSRRAAEGRPMSEAEASTYLSSFAAAQNAGQEYQDLMASQEERLQRVQGIGKQYQDLVGKQGDQLLTAQDVGDQARPITSRLEAEADKQEAPIISLLNAAAGAQNLPGLTKGAGTKADFARIMNPEVMQPTTAADVQPPVQRTQLIPQQAAPFSNIRMDRPTAVEPTIPAVSLTARPATPVASPVQVQGAQGGTQTPKAVQAKAQGQKLPVAAGSVVQVNDTSVKLSQEQADAWNALQESHDGKVRRANALTNYQERNSALRAAGMQLSAERRKITGALTSKEKADTQDVDKRLAKLLDDADNETIGDILPASVKSGGKAVPGRTRIDQSGLKRIRDALAQGKETADEKTTQIVEALRFFAEAYTKYSDQGGQALSRRFKIPKRSTPAQFAEEQTLEIERTAATVRQALAELGDAVGGNAKDVEAVVRLFKDMVQKKLVSPGSMNKETLGELGKLDTMLSQGWAAAKREAFRNKQNDTADVRGGAIRGSLESKGKGKVPTLVKVAEDGIYAGKDIGMLYGLPAILHYMRTNGTPMERALSLALRETMIGQKSNAKLEFITEGKPRFDPKTNTVYLNREESPEVILHEAFHAALQSFVYKNPNHPAVVQLKKSLKSVIGFKGELTGQALEVQTLLKDLVAKGNELDAVLELVSYGNTLNEFRKALQGMQADKTAPTTFLESVNSGWTAIKNIASRLLGGKRSLANDVLESSLELLDKARSKTPEAGLGNVLEAAVTTTKPISDAKAAEALGVSEADYTRFVEGNAVNALSTQRLFEAVGWSQENAEKLAEKMAAWGRNTAKKFPSAEIIAGLLNSRYNVNRDVSNIQDNYKFDKSVGYQIAERIANYITTQPREQSMAVFAYLDGDKKALDNVDDGGKLKGQADNLRKYFDMYVAELSPVEQRFFTTRKFTENLLFPSKTEEIASSQFAMGKINKVLGKKSEYMNELETNWLTKSESGDPLTSGDFYRVLQVNRASAKGGMITAGFMSVARFNELNRKDPLNFSVDTTRKWILESGDTDNGKYKFTTNTTAREMIDEEKLDDLANALRNTIAALANNYASKNFIRALAGMGGENSPYSKVAFDSVEDINKEYGTKVNDDQVLKVSLEMSRSAQTKDLYRMSNTWAQLPNSPVYGELAGKLIPGPVWNSMTDMMDRQPVINIRAVNTAMRWFKKSKTTLNFGTHVTNAASNITMAMMHDISFKTMRDATKLLYKYEVTPKALTTQERKMVEEFINSGAMLGDFSNAEVKEALYNAHEKNLIGGNDDSLARRVAGYMGVEKDKANFIDEYVKKGVDKAQRLDDVMSEIYGFEDNAFRMAAFMKKAGEMQLAEGSKTPSAEAFRIAGKFALKAFGDYDIDSKAVKAARQTVMPFISWAYAMTPVIGRIALTQPWKIANIVMAYYLLEAAMSSAAGGDDEELRKSGPESIRERMFFGTFGPYMHIRIPFMGDDQNPVYYKLGDYFPVASMTKGLPNGVAGQSWIPSMLTPSGPFVSTIAGVILGVDPYTGKSIHQPTDDEWKKLWNATKFGYDIIAPPSINSRQIARADDFFEGKTGITGSEPSGLFFARAMGLKLYDYNVTESEAIQGLVEKRIEKEFKSAMTKAKRDEYRKGYPDYEALDAELESLRTRMEEKIAKSRGEEE